MSGLVLVVPAADDRPGTHRLLALAEALADEPGIDLTSLLWAGGPLAPAFADLSPTIDADAVNTWGPAQALARARLTPAARLAKNRRLRSLLAPLAETRAVLVGGLAAMTAVGWLPPARTAVIVRAADVHPTPALTEADLVVAADVEAERWLTGKAEVPEDRVRRHALLEGPEPSATRADRIGLVGWDAEDVGRIVAGRTAAAGEPAAATWFVDEREAWGLWQGPTATPLAREVHVADPRGRTDDLADVGVLLIGDGGGPAADLAALAATFGAEVCRVGRHAVDAAVAVPAARATPPGGWTASARAGAALLARELVNGA